MGSSEFEQLRVALSAMPPGTLVPRDWLVLQLDALEGSPAPLAPTPQAGADLTIPGLALLFGKRPSTVRGWVERGDFPGAYKLHGREWRVPASAIQAFQDTQRRLSGRSGLSAWRSVKQKKSIPGIENGQQAARERPVGGNAED